MNTVRDLTNVCFVEEDLVLFKGKSNCKAIVIAAWCLGQCPSGVLGGRSAKIFWLFNVLGAIKWHKMALKTIIIA